jgi:hypothetical protein
MYTTVGYYSGEIKEEHKYLQFTKFKDGYVVEEKGLYINVSLDEACRKQHERFAKDPTLLRIDVMGLSESDSRQLLPK